MHAPGCTSSQQQTYAADSNSEQLWMWTKLELRLAILLNQSCCPSPNAVDVVELVVVRKVLMSQEKPADVKIGVRGKLTRS
jgi:hypothetical protein